MSSDPRFARLKTDPRFRKPRRKENKIVVDDRFKTLFEEKPSKDRKGKGKAPKIDKYGRPVSVTQERDNLRRFYRLEGDDEESISQLDNEGLPTKNLDLARGEVLLESSDEDEDEADMEGGESDPGIITLGPSSSKPRRKPKPILRPGEIDLDESEFADLDAEALDASKHDDSDDGRRTTARGEETSRIAVVNLDWDHVKASHLFKIFSSVAQLAPTPLINDGQKKKRAKPILADIGKVLSVRVYPSEYGKERMAKEETEGPPREIFSMKRSTGSLLVLGGAEGASVDEDEDEEDVNERTIFNQATAEEYDQDALRKYQLERLRYYYAIVTCDSPATAAHIYQELDGTELERSANVFDLSFVPEGMEFDGVVRDEATQESATYKGVEFVTDALRHSKVKLTWDDDDPTRMAVTRRKLTKEEIEENDFRAYIASSSEADSDAGTGEDDASRRKSKKLKERERMRALLLGGDDGPAEDLPEGWGGTTEDHSGEMEITFTPGLSEANNRKSGEDETTLERYLKKQKERREKRKEARAGKSNKEEVEDGGEAPSTNAPDDFFDTEADIPQDPSRKASKPKISPAEPSLPELKPSLPISNNKASAGESNHFDMRAVMKAEKEKRAGKKFKRKSKGENLEDEKEDGRGFEINVKDNRFAALHDEAEFAIDPSNPHFKSTHSMKALLEERSKRSRSKGHVEDVGERQERRKLDAPEDDLNKLVESVKRKNKGVPSASLEGGHRKKRPRKV